MCSKEFGQTVKQFCTGCDLLCGAEHVYCLAVPEERGPHRGRHQLRPVSWRPLPKCFACHPVLERVQSDAFPLRNPFDEGNQAGVAVVEKKHPTTMLQFRHEGRKPVHLEAEDNRVAVLEL